MSVRTFAFAAIVSAALVPPQSHAATLYRTYSFGAGPDGASPRGDLLAQPDGGLYGTAPNSGALGAGTVFRLYPAQGATPTTFETLWSFNGSNEGSFPSAGLTSDSSGALYGTTALDGAASGGTVFMLTPPAAGQTNWTEATLWSFGRAQDGATPVGTLLADRSGSGVLYGTTSRGGSHGLGTVFSLTPPAGGVGPWTEAVLWNFSGQASGATPMAALVQTKAGELIGTTSAGGDAGAGLIFLLTPPTATGASWTFSKVWIFTGGADGAAPTGTLEPDGAGSFFGTAQFGGSGNCPMARWPYYGEPDSVTAPALNAPYVGSGGNGCGLVYRVSPSTGQGTEWTQTILWTFQGGQDGANPVASVLRDKAGVLHGTTPLYGGLPAPGKLEPAFSGNVFTLTPQPDGSYSEQTITDFSFKQAGFYPRAGLVAGPSHRYYGTNSYGGTSWEHVKVYGYGAVFGTPE